jgi:hypothetical protein
MSQAKHFSVGTRMADELCKLLNSQQGSPPPARSGAKDISVDGQRGDAKDFVGRAEERLTAL